MLDDRASNRRWGAALIAVTAMALSVVAGAFSPCPCCDAVSSPGPVAAGCCSEPAQESASSYASSRCGGADCASGALRKACACAHKEQQTAPAVVAKNTADEHRAGTAILAVPAIAADACGPAGPIGPVSVAPSVHSPRPYRIHCRVQC